MHHVGIEVCLEAILSIAVSIHSAPAFRDEAYLAPLSTDTRLLVATEEGLWCRLLERIDEDRASFQTLANGLSTGNVLAPHTSTETSLAVVRTLDHLFLVRPWLGWDDWTERFLLDDHGVVWRVVDDGWLDEEALASRNVGLANGELVALTLRSEVYQRLFSTIFTGFVYLCVLEESLDLLVLHLVLDWTKVCAVDWCTDSH